MRRLVLRRQALAELAPADLEGVAAGEQQLTPQCSSTPLKFCGGTLPVNQCFVSYQCEVGP